MGDRRACPSCPDGNEWDRNGPTGRACPVCKGKAYLPNDDDGVIEREADYEMFGDEPERFGLENVGNK